MYARETYTVYNPCLVFSAEINTTVCKYLNIPRTCMHVYVYVYIYIYIYIYLYHTGDAHL